MNDTDETFDRNKPPCNYIGDVISIGIGSMRGVRIIVDATGFQSAKDAQTAHDIVALALHESTNRVLIADAIRKATKGSA